MWLGRLGSASQERALAARMAEAVAADYEAVIAEAEASEGEAEVCAGAPPAARSCSGSAGGTSSCHRNATGPAPLSTGWLHRWSCRGGAGPGWGMWIGRRARLVQRFVEPVGRVCVFVDDADEVEADATLFDMRGGAVASRG